MNELPQQVQNRSVCHSIRIDGEPRLDQTRNVQRVGKELRNGRCSVVLIRFQFVESFAIDGGLVCLSVLHILAIGGVRFLVA